MNSLLVTCRLAILFLAHMFFMRNLCEVSYWMIGVLKEPKLKELKRGFLLINAFDINAQTIFEQAFCRHWSS